MIPRKMALQTALNGCALVCLGIQLSQRGPAFIDLLRISGTDVEGGSVYLTAANLSYIIGSFLSGYLYSRVKASSLTVGVALLFAGVLSGLIPWCTNFPSMLVVFGTSTAFGGLFETTITTSQIEAGEGNSEVPLQFLSFSYSVGGILGPLITEPFLSPKDEDSVDHHDSANLTNDPSASDGFPYVSSINNGSQTDISIASTNHSLNVNDTYISSTNGTSTSIDNTLVSTPSSDDNPESIIHYAFLITAFLGLLAAIPFLLQTCRHWGKKENKHNTNASSTCPRKLPKKIYFGVLALGCLYYFLFTSLDDSFAQYLSYFVVMHLDWSKEDGALVTAVYWGFSTFVKLAVIFVASRIELGVILLASNIGMVISFVGFTIVSKLFVHSMVWVFTGLIALSMSAVFGGGMAWIDTNLVKLNSKATAAHIISAALGATALPIPIGVLMKQLTTMAFAYVLLTGAVMNLIVMIILFFIVKPMMHRKYGPPRTSIVLHISPTDDTINTSNGDALKCVSETVDEEVSKESDAKESTLFI